MFNKFTELCNCHDILNLECLCYSQNRIRLQIFFNFTSAAAAAAAAAKSLQSCPTLCDPVDGSPPGSPVPGILRARTLEWVAISFSIIWAD